LLKFQSKSLFSQFFYNIEKTGGGFWCPGMDCPLNSLNSKEKDSKRKKELNFEGSHYIITEEVNVIEITLSIKNHQLAKNMIALIKKIKDIEIFEEKKVSKKRKKSKIDEILENPYDIKDFKIYQREEIYERAGIH
jgi:hypothetical protein